MIVAVITSNNSVGGIPCRQERKLFENEEKLNEWLTPRLAEFGGFPTVMVFPVPCELKTDPKDL